MNNHSAKLLLFLILVHFQFSISQNGNWHPEINFRPRLLFTAEDSTDIIDRITHQSRYKLLYGDLYQVAQQNSTDRIQLARITKNAAFIYALNKKPLDGEIISLSRQEQEIFKQKVIDAFQIMDISIGSLFNYDIWHSRAREIIQYCQAFDLLAGSGVDEDTLWHNGGDRIAAFAANLYDAANQPFAGSVIPYNNHRINLGAALVTAAVTFNNRADSNSVYQPQKWANFGFNNIDKTLWDYQSIPLSESGYSESSYYFTFIMRYCIPTFKALKNFLGDFTETFSGRTIRNPWFDPKYKLLFDTFTKIKMPDGRAPPEENTYLNTIFPMLSVMSRIPGKPNYYSWFLDKGNKQQLSRHLANFAHRADYICGAEEFGNVPSDWNDSQFLPKAGSVVMRSSWDSSATYLHLTAKHGRARTANTSAPSGHNHADETSFMIYSEGEILALHPGYYDFSHSDSLKWGRNHNLILVDGKGPDRAAGYPYTNFIYGVDAYIRDFFSDDSLDFCDVATRYENTDIRRTVLFPFNSYFLFIDEAESGVNRKFTFQLHGNGLDSTGTYHPQFESKQAIWSSGEMRLLGKVIAQNGGETYRTVTRKHAPRYRVWKKHSALYVDKTAAKMRFLSLVYPFHQDEEHPDVQEIPVENGTGILLNTEQNMQFAAVHNDSGDMQLNVNLKGSDTVSTDGRVIFYSPSKTDSTQKILFFQDGTNFLLNGDTLIQSPDTLSVYSQLDSSTITGTILGEKATSNFITFFSRLKPLSVMGKNILNWNYENQQIRIELDSTYTTFRIELPADSIYTHLKHFNINPKTFELLQNYPNPFNSTTQFQFNLPKPTFVTLDLFDITGRHIQTILRDFKQAGYYELKWQPTQLSSGVYIYRLKTKAHEQSRKLLFLK